MHTAQGAEANRLSLAGFTFNDPPDVLLSVCDTTFLPSFFISANKSSSASMNSKEEEKER